MKIFDDAHDSAFANTRQLELPTYGISGKPDLGSSRLIDDKGFCRIGWKIK